MSTTLTPADLQSYLGKIVQVATLVHTFLPNVGHGQVIAFLTALESNSEVLNIASYVINTVVPAIQANPSADLLTVIKSALSSFAQGA
jgi:hypothetical protein